MKNTNKGGKAGSLPCYKDRVSVRARAKYPDPPLSSLSHCSSHLVRVRARARVKHFSPCVLQRQAHAGFSPAFNSAPVNKDMAIYFRRSSRVTTSRTSVFAGLLVKNTNKGGIPTMLQKQSECESESEVSGPPAFLTLTLFLTLVRVSVRAKQFSPCWCSSPTSAPTF